MVGKANICYLLRLPVEIRNLVYNYLTTVIEITSSNPADDDQDTNQPTFCLIRAQLLSMLLINKQMHEEYKVQISLQTTLQVLLRKSLNVVELQFREGFKADILRDVRRCEIVTLSDSIFDELSEEMTPDWALDRLDGKAQETMVWTPTKGEKYVPLGEACSFPP